MNSLTVAINASVSTPTTIKATTVVNKNTNFTANARIGSTSGGVVDHSKLRELSYDESGHTGFASEIALNKKVNESELSRVAKTGNYSDLNGSPTSITNLEIDSLLNN